MKKLFFTLTLVAVCCNACLKENEDIASTSGKQNSKIVGNPLGDKQEGTLLVRLSEAAVKELNEGTFDSERIFNGLSDASVHPTFPGETNITAQKYGLHKWYTVSFDSNISPETAADLLSRHAEIEAVEYNSILKDVRPSESIEYTDLTLTKSTGASSLPFNDLLLNSQWDMVNDGTLEGSVAGADVGIKDTWRLTYGDPRIIVAVLDQGIATSHPDLKDALWINSDETDGNGVDDDGNGYIDDINGYNFAEDIGKPSSKSGSDHGTHVAGTIAATNNNRTGICSIAGPVNNEKDKNQIKTTGVRLMSCQTFGKDGQMTSEWVAKAFRYAADNGASVAQCSYGHNDMKGMSLSEIAKWMNESVEYKALQYFLDPANANCDAVGANIAVYSAGNYNNPASLWPGAVQECISVTAFCHDFLPGGYSNYGAGCDIAAPGGDIVEGDADAPCMILSTGLNRDGAPAFVYKYGTSMACPHVSGVVALGMSYALKLGKKFSREEFTSRLLGSAYNIDGHNNASSMKLWVHTYYNQGQLTSEYQQTDVFMKRGKMGAGAVDAWNFLMALEGTPSFITIPGQQLSLDLSKIAGADYEKYTVEMSAEAKEALGVTDTPSVTNGIMELTCTKIGSGKINLKASVGKDENGVIPELDYYKEISIVSRPAVASNGGWL